jgi:DNA (cytosine-5)-methyltransferase 1
VFGSIAARYRSSWLVWENVPGVLSSNGGRDFALFLGLLAGRQLEVPDGGWKSAGIIPGIADAYGLAYRGLDAQYVRVDGFQRAVPQRRRRVFVVGYLGDWRAASAVLFEQESLRWNPAPRRKAGQGFAANVVPSLKASGCGVSRVGDIRGQDPVVAVGFSADVAPTLNAHFGSKMGLENQHVDGGCGLFVAAPLVPEVAPTIKRDYGKGYGDGEMSGGGLIPETAHTLKAAFEASEDGSGRGTPLVPEAQPMAFDCKASGRNGFSVSDEIAPTIRAMGSASSHQNAGGQVAISHNYSVRRLIPVECERLQGFWDNYTLIPWRGKVAEFCPDGPRYKSMGNSMPVNVMRWLGRRIDLVHKLILEGAL